MGKRRRARELAVQVLFHLVFNPGDPAAAFDLVCGNIDASPDIRPFAASLVMGVTENGAAVREAIVKASENWRLERMPHVDRCILSMAVFELLYREDIPPKVSIDEAVELGKKFGSEDSARFINGVLDHVFTTRIAESVASKDRA